MCQPQPLDNKDEKGLVEEIIVSGPNGSLGVFHVENGILRKAPSEAKLPIVYKVENSEF